MANRLPYMQFYPADWLAATRLLTVRAKGAWIDVIAMLWGEDARGIATESGDAWARLLGVSSNEIPELMTELSKVAIVIQRPDMAWTIASRRIIREEIERERSRNSKKPEEDRVTPYKNHVAKCFPELFAPESRKIPELFAPESRKIPGRFPEDSRTNPGEILEARDQIPDIVPVPREGPPDQLAPADLLRIDEFFQVAGLSGTALNVNPEKQPFYVQNIEFLTKPEYWEKVKKNVKPWMASVDWKSPVTINNIAPHLQAIVDFNLKGTNTIDKYENGF